MVGINIILSVGNEYVKLAWKFRGKPWQENRGFQHFRKFEREVCHNNAYPEIVFFITAQKNVYFILSH